MRLIFASYSPHVYTHSTYRAATCNSLKHCGTMCTHPVQACTQYRHAHPYGALGNNAAWSNNSIKCPSNICDYNTPLHDAERSAAYAYDKVASNRTCCQPNLECSVVALGIHTEHLSQEQMRVSLVSSPVIGFVPDAILHSCCCTSLRSTTSVPAGACQSSRVVLVITHASLKAKWTPNWGTGGNLQSLPAILMFLNFALVTCGQAMTTSGDG